MNHHMGARHEHHPENRLDIGQHVPWAIYGGDGLSLSGARCLPLRGAVPDDGECFDASSAALAGPFGAPAAQH